MKGYKGMTKDMTCRGMKYEVGKTYHVDGEVILCRNGLHFCKNLADVYRFYPREDSNRFFEVEAAEPVLSDGHKSVTASLKIIRELTDKERNRAVYCGNGYGYGNGNGNVNGYGDGNSDSYGYGNGNGNGDGYGYGNGNGNGDGNGIGYGDGNGYGYHYDNGDSYNMQNVLMWED